MTITPTLLEGELSLGSAAARFEFLARRDALAPVADASGDDDDDSWFRVDAVGAGLDQLESLELLALGEVIRRKAQLGRQLSIRSALRNAASWRQIGAALDIAPAAAWAEHVAWIDGQVADHQRVGHEGLDPATAAQARALAGPRPA
jgi:hypothetical protein